MSDELARTLDQLATAAQNASELVGAGLLAISDKEQEGELVGGLSHLAEMIEEAVQKATVAVCRTCEKQDSYDGQGPTFEKLLPGVHEGRGRRESLGGFSDNLPARDRAFHQDVFKVYENRAFLFSSKQWAAIVPRYQAGLTHEEIGKKLGISRTAVTGRLIRARKTLEDAVMRHFRSEQDIR